MTLRLRTIVAAAVATMIAVVVLGAAVDVLVARHLRRELDRTLHTRAVDVAQRAGRTVPLSEREADVLALLLRNARRVVPRDRAIAEIWQGDANANVVDRYVSNLRRKLGEPQLIETVRGVGFVIGR